MLTNARAMISALLKLSKNLINTENGKRYRNI